ncbi:ANR family transcriptional regulator [Serratia marcescens]|nr:ANR family transcriptional regulator [Serratia marcescens]
MVSDFKQLSEAAAEQERLGKFKQASEPWLEAFIAAKRQPNQKWCEVRREICLTANRSEFRRKRAEGKES